MGRGFEIAGEAIVTVSQKFTTAGAVDGTNVASDLNTKPDAQGNGGNLPSVLGLADGQIKVSPVFHHYDIKADDFGPDVPPETLWMLGTVQIDMTLVHFDRNILEICCRESMGGGTPDALAGAGTPMHGHYIYLIVKASPGWIFPTAYLAQSPFEWPIGAERSLVRLRWRAIPHAGTTAITAGNASSAGANLFSF